MTISQWNTHYMEYSIARSLNLSSDISIWILIFWAGLFFVRWGCPVRCRMSSCISGLYPSLAPLSQQLWQSNMLPDIAIWQHVSRHCQNAVCGTGAKLSPFENHCLTDMQRKEPSKYLNSLNSRVPNHSFVQVERTCYRKIEHTSNFLKLYMWTYICL